MHASETIYNWVERPEVKREKPPMYRSKYDPRQPPTGSTFVPLGTTKMAGANLGEESTDAVLKRGSKRAGATFGAAPGSLKPDPHRRPGRRTAFGTESLPSRRPFGRSEEPRKPAVPKRSERPVMGVRTSKDFVMANAVENILAVPKGRREDEPRFVEKADYGKVPAYLSKVQSEIEEEKQLIEQMYMQGEPEEEVAAGEELEAREREELLSALKAKWDEVNRQYSKITHMTKLDSMTKIRYKEQYERQLAQLEKDIDLLEQKRPICVVHE